MQRNRFPVSLGGRYLLAAASLALALAGVASGTAQAGTAAAGGPLPLTVRTDHGLVRGLHQHGAREFLGIPYAAPPTGRSRSRRGAASGRRGSQGTTARRPAASQPACPAPACSRTACS